MEMLEGQNIGVLPYKGLKKVSDLIFYEGPIFSHFRDAYGVDILFYWVDYNNTFNRWLVFKVTEKQLYEYLLKKKNLKQLFDNPENNVFYSLEIGSTLEFSNISLLYKEDLPNVYYPEENTFFANEIPAIYNDKLKIYEDDVFVDALLENAVCLKAKPTNSKNKSLVGVLDAKDFLGALGESFMGLLDFVVKRDFFERVGFDEKRIKNIITELKSDLQPTLLKVSISSFAVAINSNHITNSPESFIDTSWKKNLFNDFKHDVIDFDKKNDKEVSNLIDKYPDNIRNEIYRPLIALYNNKKISIEITDKNFKTERTVKPIQKKNIDKVINNKEGKQKEEPVDGFAHVKYYKGTGKILNAGYTLFEQKILPVWSTNEIRAKEENYTLSRKIYAEYKIEEGEHVLECEELGIFSHGESLTDAEAAFYEEFDFIYKRYTELENEKLTDDVISIKESLIRLVKAK